MGKKDFLQDDSVVKDKACLRTGPVVAVLGKLGKKLNSQRGASLLVALLLFMLCTAVGSVVLTAGTASAGRLSRAREMDRRYYSVTSAAELLRDVVESERIVVERTKATTITTVTSYEADEGSGQVAVVSSNTSTHDAYHSTLNGGTVRRGQSLLTDAAVSVVFGEDDVVPDRTYANETLWAQSVPAAFTPYSRSVSMVHAPYNAAIDAQALRVRLTETVRSDGTLVFLLASDDGGTEQYRLQLTFTLNVESRENTGTSAFDPEVSGSGESYIETTVSTVTTTKTDQLTWTLTDIGKAP